MMASIIQLSNALAQLIGTMFVPNIHYDFWWKAGFADHQIKAVENRKFGFSSPSNFWSPRHTSTSASATNWGQVRYLRQAKSEDWSNGLSFRFRRKSPSPSINDLTHPNSSNTQHTYVGGFVAFSIQQARRRSISVISLVHTKRNAASK